MTKLLAYIPSPPQGVWHLGWLPIRAYALCIIVGIVVGLFLGDRRWVARGGEPGVIYDIALWAVPFGLLGGRLYHVMTDWKMYFAAGGVGPLGVFKIWDGGLGIWGAVALGGVGAWIGCRRRGIPVGAFGDAIAPGIILAQAIGRIGNYFNQELYGRPTTVPWALEIFYRRDPSGVIDPSSHDGVSTGQLFARVHPTFLYELIWDVLVFVFLIWIDRRFKIGHARLFALYLASYCLGRFWVELMRSDPATHIAGIRINSFTSTFVFIGAMVYFLLAPKGREDPATLGGAPAEAEVTDVIPVTDKAKELVGATAAGGAIAAAAAVADKEDEAAEAEDAAAEEAAEAEEPEKAAEAEEPEKAATEEAATEEAAAEEPGEPEVAEEAAAEETAAEEAAEPEVAQEADGVSEPAEEAQAETAGEEPAAADEGEPAAAEEGEPAAGEEGEPAAGEEGEPAAAEEAVADTAKGEAAEEAVASEPAQVVAETEAAEPGGAPEEAPDEAPAQSGAGRSWWDRLLWGQAGH